MVKNLKALRIEKGISQQQLASVIGLSQQSVNKYENHNVEPDIATLIALAVYFETSVDYLIGFTSVRKPYTHYTPSELSESENKLINTYRKLSPDERVLIDVFMKTYLEVKKS